MDDLKIENEDLYGLLEIEISATKADIKKAYRKKALQCHPDKNPDNPNAAKEFHKLSKVLEILTDDAARAAYDKVLKAKKEAEIRHQELDGKRRKLKEDLEARERLAQLDKKGKDSDALNLQKEIERLRKEGSRQVEEEMDIVMQQLREEKLRKEDSWESSQHRIKIKWNAPKSDKKNGGYTQELLHQFLSKYGDLEALVMSKKNGSAIVEFTTKRGAEMAMDFEKGLSANPLTLEWINGPPKSKNSYNSTTIKESDFESVVLTKMRQAEERKRLIEQMMKEDAEES